MSPEEYYRLVKYIELCSRSAMLALMLVAAPHVSAQANREPDDGSEDDRQLRITSGKTERPGNLGATTLSIPLSGTGVQAHATPSKPKGLSSPPVKVPSKKAATTGNNKDVRNKDSATAHAPEATSRTRQSEFP